LLVLDTEFVTQYLCYCTPALVHLFTKLNTAVQSVVPMSISLLALNEHKLLNALMHTINALISSAISDQEASNTWNVFSAEEDPC